MKIDDKVSKTAPKFFYGWTIVGVCWLINFANVSYFNPVLSVFIKPLDEDLGWSRTAIAGAVTFGTILGAIAGPIIGPILDRRGPKLVTVVGFIAAIFGLFALAFIHDLWLFYLAFGVGRAVATGITGLASTVAVSNWFIRYRARAMGISMTGIRAGAAIMPLSVQLIILATGNWRLSWIFLGCLITLATIAPSMLFLKRRPEDVNALPDGIMPSKTTDTGYTHNPDSQDLDNSWSLKEAMSTRSFWMVILATSQFFFVSGAVNLHLVPYLNDQGISLGMAAFSLTVLSIAGGVGSILWGLIAEKIFIRWTLTLAFLISGVAVFGLLFVHSLTLAILFAIAYGLSYGGLVALNPVVFADYFGRANLGAIRGFSNPFQLAANSTGFLFAAAVYDINHSYDVAFIVLSIAYISAGGWMLLAQPPRRVK